MLGGGGAEFSGGGDDLSTSSLTVPFQRRQLNTFRDSVLLSLLRSVVVSVLNLHSTSQSLSTNLEALSQRPSGFFSLVP